MYEHKPYFDPKEGTDGCGTADIVAEFAACMKRGDSPDSPAAQSAAEQWCACRSSCGCDAESAENLAFDAEAYGTGTTNYITEAIRFYRKGH